MRRKYVLYGVVLACVVALISSMGGVSSAVTLPDSVSVGYRGGWDVRVTPDERVILIHPDGATTTDIGEGLHAQVDHQGNVFFGSWELGLMVHNRKSGLVTRLAAPQTVSPPFLLNADGKKLAVHIHDNFASDDTPMTTGVAVIDLTSGELKPVLVNPYNYVLAFGWRGDDLFIQTFGHDTGHPVFEILDLNGKRTPQPANDLPYSQHFPQVAPDQRYLTYEYDEAVALIDMSRGSIHKINGASAPEWKGNKLFATIHGKKQEVVLPAVR